MFGMSKWEKFGKISIDFMNSLTQHEVTSIVERYPRHFKDDFLSLNQAGQVAFGPEWPSAENTQSMLLGLLNNKMWWLTKFHQAVFKPEQFELSENKAVKIQKDHLMGRKKLFVHELLYFHCVFGEAAVRTLPENDFPKHFLDRFERFKTMEIPGQEGDLVTLKKWCELTEAVRLATLN